MRIIYNNRKRYSCGENLPPSHTNTNVTNTACNSAEHDIIPGFKSNSRNIELKDYGPNPFVVNIQEASKQNDYFRTALWTGTHLQVTLMSIPVGGEIGLEIHPDTDQFLRIEEGQGLVKMGDRKDYLLFQEKVCAEYAIIVPAGKWHNLINTGDVPIKLYSIYAPPQHPHGTVHVSKEDAEAAEKLHERQQDEQHCQQDDQHKNQLCDNPEEQHNEHPCNNHEEHNEQRCCNHEEHYNEQRCNNHEEHHNDQHCNNHEEHHNEQRCNNHEEHHNEQHGNKQEEQHNKQFCNNREKNHHEQQCCNQKDHHNEQNCCNHEEHLNHHRNQVRITPAHHLFGAEAAKADRQLTLENMLIYAIQDEYLARARYLLAIEKFGRQRPFSNILNAVEMHINYLITLSTRYHVVLPTDNSAYYVNKSDTIKVSLQVSVQGEIENIAMYERFLTQNLPNDVKSVFVLLKNASQSHLQAFQRILSFH